MRPPNETGFLALVMLLGAFCAPAWAGVTFAEGRLTVRFEGAPAREALRELEEAAPVTVRAPEAVLARRLNATFESLDLDEGMTRILRALGVENHAVLRDADGERRTYVVLEEGGSARGAEGSTPGPGLDDPDDEDTRGEAVVATHEGISRWHERHERWKAEQDAGAVREAERPLRDRGAGASRERDRHSGEGDRPKDRDGRGRGRKEARDRDGVAAGGPRVN